MLFESHWGAPRIDVCIREVGLENWDKPMEVGWLGMKRGKVWLLHFASSALLKTHHAAGFLT